MFKDTFYIIINDIFISVMVYYEFKFCKYFFKYFYKICLFQDIKLANKLIIGSVLKRTERRTSLNCLVNKIGDRIVLMQKVNYRISYGR
jgi:hypothetical protein